ncbi:MAG: type VI secretion system tip protein TssI/VgrG [Byssovorax sp.]
MSDVFTIKSSALPGETRVVGFRGHEEISRPYAFEIYLVMLGDEGAVFDMADAIGAKATLSMHRGSAASPYDYHGVFSTMELVHQIEDRALFRAVLVPQLWQLKLTYHSRMFTKMNVPDIIKEVLEDSGFTTDDYEFKFNPGEYAEEEHVCQYQESNFDFISRWMEREGMYYFFEQGEDREKLVIANKASAHDHLVHKHFRYHPVASRDVTASEHFDAFTSRHVSLPATVRMRDYDYLKPSLDVSGTAPVSPNGLGEINVYGARFFSPDEGKRLAKLRAEELKAREVVFVGSAAAFHLRSGYLFDLDDHPRAAFNATYLTTSVDHYGNQSATTAELKKMTGLDSSDVYQAKITAIAKDVQFRAERVTPIPRIFGMENAVVDGPAESEYAQIDKEGRYAVKFKFDESDYKDGKASTWVRMLQPHGGGKEGFHFPLRKGTEVLVIFLGGDPDRPMIAGVVPNAHKPSPVIAANHTKNVIQTGGENRIEMEDLAGNQYIKITCPTKETMLHLGQPHNPTHNIQLETKGNSRFKFGTDWDITVGGHLFEEVTGDVKETYKATQKTHVTGLVEETYDASQETKVTGHQKTVVTADVSEDYGGTLKTHVKGAVTTDFDSGQTFTIKSGGQKETITGPHTITLTGSRTETITENLTQNINGAVVITTPQTYTINCPSVTINASSGHTIINPAQHVEVHGFWDKSAWTATEKVGLKFSLFGVKIDVGAVAVSLQAAKIDTTGVKVDNYLAKSDCGPMKLSTHGTKLRNTALALYLSAVILMS